MQFHDKTLESEGNIKLTTMDESVITYRFIRYTKTSRTSISNFQQKKQNVYINDDKYKVVHLSKMKVSILANLLAITETGLIFLYLNQQFANKKKSHKKFRNFLHCFDSYRVPIFDYDSFFCNMELIYIKHSKNFLFTILKNYNLNLEDFFFEQKLSVSKKTIDIKRIYKF